MKTKKINSAHAKACVGGFAIHISKLCVNKLDLRKGLPNFD